VDNATSKKMESHRAADEAKTEAWEACDAAQVEKSLQCLFARQDHFDVSGMCAETATAMYDGLVSKRRELQFAKRQVAEIVAAMEAARTSGEADSASPSPAKKPCFGEASAHGTAIDSTPDKLNACENLTEDAAAASAKPDCAGKTKQGKHCGRKAGTDGSPRDFCCPSTSRGRATGDSRCEYQRR
jgi:hypothetical protein